MADLIDRGALYEQTAEWEARALHMVEKTMNDEDKTEWRKWTAILNERTAFKHDVADAPSVEPDPRWIPCEERLPENGHYYLWCSDMGNVQSDYYWNGFEEGMKYGYNIVAWMPLPQPYERSEE